MTARLFPFALLALTACVPAPEGNLSRTTASVAGGECGTPGTAPCRFRNAPLQLAADAVTLPGRPYPFHRLLNTLDFTDATGRGWRAPQATLTDGASIPPVFVPLIGSPRTPEFALAAALHDAWCGVGNEGGPVWHKAPWQEVHRMFYDTLVAGGTEPVRAKVMFAAVWLGGPRWLPSGQPDTRMERLRPEDRRREFAALKTRIERDNPPLPVLLGWLDRSEDRLLDAAALRTEAAQEGAQDSPNEGYEGTAPL